MNEQAEKNIFTVVDEEGKEIECEVLFTFDSKETGKSYIAYTDHSTDEGGNIQVFASIFDPNEEDGKLEPIESEKEWKIIESILESLKETQEEAEQAEATEENNESGQE